ncbi:MAG: ATP-binding cassette domain-containing protein, partial [Candidatus Acidiferrales bacterium]
MQNLLQVMDLRVSYRGADAEVRDAVDGVGFAIAPGEVLGLMGESGCGKTSTALALLGLLSDRHAQVSGSVQFRG